MLKAALTSAVGLGAVLAATSAQAVVVYSGLVNLAIPVTTNGLYLNVVTGANELPVSTVGTTVPGWDINLHSTNGLGFFNPASPAGGSYVVSSGTAVANQTPGALIGAGSSFGSGGTTLFSQWNLNSPNSYLGFRFTNEATGQVHYGWGQFSLGAAPDSAGWTLIAYGYESTPGVGIAVGAVPEPGAYALMGPGLAGVLLVARRRPGAGRAARA